MSNTSRRHALPIAVALTISTAALVLFIREASAQEATKPAPETPAATETPPAATNSSPPPATAGGETKPKSPELPEVKIIQEKEPPKPVEEAAPKPKKKPAPVAEYYDPAPAPQKVKKKSPSKPKTVPTVEASGPSEPATSDGATSIADGTAAGGSVPAKGTGFGTRTADTAGKGYAAPDATTATKTNAPVFETPFSVQTVPSDMIADQAVTRVDQALKNVSGVQINREGIFDGITLRGFKQGLDRWVYRDGAPFINQTFDFANIDRVEVLKGTAGGIYGRIDPGGLVNFVTKKPLAEPHFAIEQEVRSFGGYRTVGDVTGPVTNDGSLRYRTIVAFEDSDSFRDLVGSQNILVSPSISWDLTPTDLRPKSPPILRRVRGSICGLMRPAFPVSFSMRTQLA